MVDKWHLTDWYYKKVVIRNYLCNGIAEFDEVIHRLPKVISTLPSSNTGHHLELSHTNSLICIPNFKYCQ